MLHWFKKQTSAQTESECFPSHLEFVISVLGAFVEGPVVPKTPNVVDSIEALDAVWYSVHLEDADAVRHRCDRVDLEVWAEEVKEVYVYSIWIYGRLHLHSTSGNTWTWTTSHQPVEEHHHTDVSCGVSEGYTVRHTAEWLRPADWGAA